MSKKQNIITSGKQLREVVEDCVKQYIESAESNYQSEGVSKYDFISSYVAHFVHGLLTMLRPTPPIYNQSLSSDTPFSLNDILNAIPEDLAVLFGASAFRLADYLELFLEDNHMADSLPEIIAVESKSKKVVPNTIAPRRISFAYVNYFEEDIVSMVGHTFGLINKYKDTHPDTVSQSTCEKLSDLSTTSFIFLKGGLQFPVYAMVACLSQDRPFDGIMSDLISTCEGHKTELEADPQGTEVWTEQMAGYTIMCKALSELQDTIVGAGQDLEK